MMKFSTLRNNSDNHQYSTLKKHKVINIIFFEFLLLIILTNKFNMPYLLSQ